MHCYLCGQEAVHRCFTCGQLICEQHGEENCRRCQTAIVPGDVRADRVSAVPLSSGRRPGWWRPQQAEEFDPPACYHCKGLARQACQHCHNLFCPDHAGSRGLCAYCSRSSLIGLWVFLAMLLLMVILIVWGTVQNL